MSLFLFKVRDDQGRSLQGVMEANSASEVKQVKRNEQFFFLSVEPFDRKTLATLDISLQSLAIFTHRFMSLVEAGIPILVTMQILWRQTEERKVQIAVSYIKTQLEEGRQISAAMDDLPRIFPLVYRSMIRVGEISGTLVPILKKLTEYVDYQLKVIERVKRATLYPCLVIVFSLLVVIGMFVFVVPTFQKVLLRLHVELPALTKMVLAISQGMRSMGFIVFCISSLALGMVAYHILKRDERFGYYVDKMFLKIPYFGELLALFSLSQVTRALSILLGAGVPILDSFRVAGTTAGNRKTGADMEAIMHQVEQGASLYDSFRKTRGFPVMLVEMIGIGESTGLLTPVLERVTKHFDEELDYELNRFLTILEPALIVFVGVIVVVTLLAIYLPVISIWQGLMSR